MLSIVSQCKQRILGTFCSILIWESQEKICKCSQTIKEAAFPHTLGSAHILRFGPQNMLICLMIWRLMFELCSDPLVPLNKQLFTYHMMWEWDISHFRFLVFWSHQGYLVLKGHGSVNNMKEEIYKHAFPTEGTQIREIAVEAAAIHPTKEIKLLHQTNR